MTPVQRRRRSRSSDAVVRKRQLFDLIQMASLYRKQSLLTILSQDDDKFDEAEAQEFSVVAAISLHGAKKVLKLLGLRYNSETWEFLKANSRLAIFEDSQFTKSYLSIKSAGGVLPLDFLEAFVNGENPQMHEQKLQRRRKLDAVALSFTAKARDACVTMFFKVVSVIATLCSFIPASDNLDKLKVTDIIERYLSDSWYSDARQRQYHEFSNQIQLVDGWHLVNDLFKVQVQELMFWKENMKDDEGLVTEQDVCSNANTIVHHSASEFIAWCYHFVSQTYSATEFLEGVIDVLDGFCEKLGRDVGCHEIEDVPETIVTRLFEQVFRNAPTMAEIRYDAAGMKPSMRDVRASRSLNWVPKDVLMRCRWPGSPAMEYYDAYIKSCKDNTKGDQNREKGNNASAPVRHSRQGPSYRTCQDSPDEYVLPTPPPIEHVPSSGVKRLYGDLDSADYLKRQRREQEQLKRLKSCVHGNMVRLQANAYNAEQQRISQGGRQPRVKLPISYLNDGDFSDGEEFENEDSSAEEEEASHDTANFAIQLFYELVLDWPILPLSQTDCPMLDFKNPITSQERAAVSDLLTNNTRWVSLFTNARKISLYRDVTSAPIIERYREHWKNIIPFEVRGMISEEIAKLLPSVKENKKMSWVTDIEEKSWITTTVDKVAPVKGILNLVCRSVDPQVGKRAARELQGGIIGIAYITGVKGGHVLSQRKRSLGGPPLPPAKRFFSRLILVACRRVSWDDEDETPLGDDDRIDEVKLHLSVSRERLRDHGIWEGNTLRLIHLCHFSPYLRMFRSVQECHKVPTPIQKVLFGARVSSPDSREAAFRQGDADDASVQYLKYVRKTTGTLDKSQYDALHATLSNIGDCVQDSSSVSLIQGPPGTGKTTTILLLIGALLHHSTAGHAGHEQVHALREKLPADDILRCSFNRNGVKILVCCASNQAVDNVLRRLDNDGIPDGQGGRMFPQCVRVAKNRHDYGSLVPYSVDKKALPFDNYIHHVNQVNRRHASCKARKSFGRECLVTFVTLCTSGSARLKALKMSYDVIIVDEAGQALEPETLIPITSTRNNSRLGRCHLVLVGDPKQLPPVSNAEHMVSISKRKMTFEYSQQIISLFERLQRMERATSSLLTQQYRMHPCISGMHSPIFYNGKVSSPLPAAEFHELYNKGWERVTEMFSPVTLIDTQLLPDRFEVNDRKGSITNCMEINLIDEVLRRLKQLTGDKFSSLRRGIAVLVPYRSQVDQARNALEGFGKYRPQGVSRDGFDILVDTVDSMQGQERDIVIFAATRSNSNQEVGFMDRANRLNVAISRSRKLLVIIADLSTMFATREFEEFRKYCMAGTNGASLLIRKATRNGRIGGKPELVLKESEPQ